MPAKPMSPRGSITLSELRGLLPMLERLIAEHGERAGPPQKGFILVRRELVAKVKFFGRHKRGYIRDGVILSVVSGVSSQ